VNNLAGLGVWPKSFCDHIFRRTLWELRFSPAVIKACYCLNFDFYSKTLNWSSLLPKTWNPLAAWNECSVASTFLQGVTDVCILLTVYGGGVLLLWAIWRMVGARRLTRKYSVSLPNKTQSFAQHRRALASRVELPLLADFDAYLIEVPRGDGTMARDLHRCGDAAEVFNDASLAHKIVGNRLFLATPGILTGLGVLGTFVGLQLGIGSLDLSDKGLEKLDQSIKPLIQGSSTAFATSVWGVICSLLFIVFEKFLESGARHPIRKLQNQLNALVPRYAPEESMLEMQQSAGETKLILQGLAVAIGEQMQTAMDRLGESITKAATAALSGQAGDLGKKSAEMMSEALRAELTMLRNEMTGMGERFRSEFTEATSQLQKTVAGFDPVVQALGETVNTALATVSDAVDKLNKHEEVMPALATASERIYEAAGMFKEMRETLEASSRHNLSAAEAQEKAVRTTLVVAGHFERIAKELPEIGQTIEDGARIIGSLGQPLLELSALLSKTPEILEGQAARQAQGEEARTSKLLAQTESLVKAVADAASKFSEVDSLAEHLSGSAEKLRDSGRILESFGKELGRSSEAQTSAAASSERAAAAGLKAAEALLPIPDRLEGMTGQLEAAGSSIEAGAIAARDAYGEAAKFGCAVEVMSMIC
jgi:ABC-type transporter Mla subunit MlaD